MKEKAKTFAEIIQANRQLESQLDGALKYGIFILSNITVSQLGVFLEYRTRSAGILGRAETGNYDTILQDSMNGAGMDCAVIFCELGNLVEGFQYRALTMSDREIHRLIDHTKQQIDAVIANLQSVPTVFFNRFSTLAFSSRNILSNRLDECRDALNGHLLQNRTPNIVPVDIEKPMARVSVSKAVDRRFWKSSKALYTPAFFRSYAEHVSPLITASRGKMKKALIFDCDNTLWGGIIGEDGMQGIRMSSKDGVGAIYEEIQHLAKAMGRQGVIIGLCSKNNPEDVDEVFEQHPDMVLRPDDIVAKRVNWRDKPSNIQEIAAELNIGLDSLVFIDDSPFECEMVREQLPEVTVLRVPERLSDYPDEFRNIVNLFGATGKTVEDAKRVQMYKHEQSRIHHKKQFTSLDDYLGSLGLKVVAYRDNLEHVSRIAQMTQRTNQFNLTTKRYKESEIEAFVKSEDHVVYSFSVSDKFGDYGITAACIAKLEPDSEEAGLDTLLMSCRVIGRTVEQVALGYALNNLFDRGRSKIRAQWIKTAKNAQVETFYDSRGFELMDQGEGSRSYQILLDRKPEIPGAFIRLEER